MSKSLKRWRLINPNFVLTALTRRHHLHLPAKDWRSHRLLPPPLSPVLFCRHHCPLHWRDHHPRRGTRRQRRNPKLIWTAYPLPARNRELLNLYHPRRVSILFGKHILIMVSLFFHCLLPEKKKTQWHLYILCCCGAFAFKYDFLILFFPNLFLQPFWKWKRKQNVVWVYKEISSPTAVYDKQYIYIHPNLIMQLLHSNDDSCSWLAVELATSAQYEWIKELREGARTLS